MKLSRKKIAIIAISGLVAITAIGGLYITLKDDRPNDRLRRPLDPNLPNPQKQTPQEIMAYMQSNQFRQLTPQQRMQYGRYSMHKVMDYQVETYYSLPEEQKVAFLDKAIDQMQEHRKEFEQFRQQRQAQRAAEGQNNTNQQQTANQQGRSAGQGRRAPDPSRMRARSERGTAAERAKRDRFFNDMRKRAEQRGISMPGPGGGRG